MAETNTSKETLTKEDVGELKVEGKKESTMIRNKAFETLKELVDASLKSDPEASKKYEDAMKVVRPSLYGLTGGGGGGTSNPLYNQIMSKIKEAGKAGLHEDELFKQFKIGRKETNAHYKQSLRRAEPANRVWIEFNPSNGIYSVVGEGENPPATYKGWKPVDESVNLK